MKHKTFASLAFCLVIVLLGLTGCSSNSQNAQQREQQDEKTRQEAADATETAKQDARIAAQKLDEAGKKLAHKAEVVGQGAKEGWNREKSRVVDLNTASQADFESLPGLSRDDAQKIVSNRPYKSTHDLVTRGIVSEGEYRQIENRIVVK